MLAKHILPTCEAEKKIFQAVVALLSAKFAALAILALSFVAVVLFVFYLIFDAIYEVCTQLALLWGECNAIEKLLYVLIAWAFAAWVLKRVKGLRHAA